MIRFTLKHLEKGHFRGQIGKSVVYTEYSSIAFFWEGEGQNCSKECDVTLKGGAHYLKLALVRPNLGGPGPI